jgi:hypothetical protein
VVRVGFDLAWRPRSDALAYDERTDGIFPLVTSDRKLSPKEILQAHKLGQPGVEQRHHHLKAVHEVAPQYLKSVARIEAFLCVYFFALLVNALIERKMRQAMKHRRVKALPIYPEGRPCKRPTTEQILRIFESLMVHQLRARAVLSTYTSPTSPACRSESCGCSVSSHKPTESAWSRDRTKIRRNHLGEVRKTGWIQPKTALRKARVA